MIINYNLSIPLFLRKKIFIILGCFSLACLVKYFFLEHYLSLAYFHEHLESLQLFIDQHYYGALFLYSLAYSTAAACALPGSSFFMIIAGLFFHIFVGTIVALASATLGALCLFCMMRSLIGNCIQKKFEQRIAHLHQEITQHGHYYLLMVRFAALIPFGMTNILASCTPITLATFLWTTTLGIIPVTIVCTYIGQQLRSLPTANYTYSQFFIAIGLSVLFRVIIVPWLYKRLKGQKKRTGVVVCTV